MSYDTTNSIFIIFSCFAMKYAGDVRTAPLTRVNRQPFCQPLLKVPTLNRI